MSLRPAVTSSVVDTGRASTWSESSDSFLVGIFLYLSIKARCASRSCGQDVRVHSRAPRKTKPATNPSLGRTGAGWKLVFELRRQLATAHRPTAPPVESGP